MAKIIPAETSCPSKDWTLEYLGFIMSMVEHKGQGDKDVFDDVYYATSYVCVDSDAEVLPNSHKAHNDGSFIYMEGADTSWF